MILNPWKLITKIVGVISLLFFAFNRGKKTERQENINNNYKEMLQSVERRNKRNADSDADVKRRLRKQARDAK